MAIWEPLSSHPSPVANAPYVHPGTVCRVVLRYNPTAYGRVPASQAVDAQQSIVCAVGCLKQFLSNS